MKSKFLYVLLICAVLIGCSSSDKDELSPAEETGSGNSPSSSSWLIPIDEVKDGGPGKDGIPSIDSPKFVFVNDAGAEYLNGSDLVVGYVNGDVVRAYPHQILDWHEVVNDKVGNDNITISYCTLTGTAFGWKSMTNGTQSTFGVSGLLYNSNLILYDRNTDSYWSQLGLKCVNGNLIGTASWQSSRLQADRIWLATTTEFEVEAIPALLLYARQSLSTQRTLAINYPAYHGEDGFSIAGFMPHKTLIWMHIAL